MANKTYQLINWLSMNLKLTLPDDRSTRVLFAGGKMYPKWFPGRFSTDDKEIQKALESHKWFNTEYRLTQSSGEKFDARPVSNSSAPGLPQGGNDDTLNEIIYEGIVTAKEVKRYLIEKKGASPGQVKNVDAIDKFCEEHHIVFMDWITQREADDKG